MEKIGRGGVVQTKREGAAACWASLDQVFDGDPGTVSGWIDEGMASRIACRKRMEGWMVCG